VIDPKKSLQFEDVFVRNIKDLGFARRPNWDNAACRRGSRGRLDDPDGDQYEANQKAEHCWQFEYLLGVFKALRKRIINQPIITRHQGGRADCPGQEHDCADAQEH